MIAHPLKTLDSGENIHNGMPRTNETVVRTIIKK